MGAINIKHTGSGADIALSSDGTSLLLDGTAIGGGGTALELYAENPSSPTAPSATGTNAVAIGSGSVSAATNSIAINTGDALYGVIAGATNGIAIGYQARVRANVVNSLAIGFSADVNNTQSTAVGYNAHAFGTNSQAFGSGAYSANDRALALGYNTSAGTAGSTAIGSNAASQGSVVATGAGAMALGGSYASGTDSFAAAIGNNTSSYGATGANSVAIGNLAKATGADSFAFGESSQATAADAIALGRTVRSTSSYATAMGYNCLSSSNYSVALGYQATASGANAIAAGASSTYAERATASGAGSVALGGAYATATDSVSIGASSTTGTTIGKIAFSNDKFSDNGDSQHGLFVLRSDTTDATPEALVTNTGGVSWSNQIALPNNSAYGFTGIIVAREAAASTDDFAVWEIKGGAVRGASAATTALGTYNINKISESAGAANWSIALSADTTNGAVAITVTGEAAHNIRWVATINTSEVTY